MAPKPEDISSPQEMDPQSASAQLPSQPAQSQWQGSTSNPLTSTPSHIASKKYVHEFRALMDSQRMVFNDERDLWHMERSDLLAEIGRLRGLLSSQGAPSSHISSPIGSSRQPKVSFPGFAGFPSTSSSSGDEFWRGAGGKSDNQPTRTFSDPPNQLPTRLPSISENAAQRTSSLTNPSFQTTIPQNTGGDLDGINFKKSREASSTDSTSQSPLSSRESPGKLQIPAPQPPPLPATCNTMHAGHIPLAGATDGAMSESSSNLDTPRQPETESTPIEPRPSSFKPPTERSDSYFPGAVEGDPALQEPLGLETKPTSGSDAFLKTLDSKLEDAAKGKDVEKKEPEVHKRTTPDPSDPKLPESEPKLRLKKSLNFGSQLGSLQ